MSAWVVAVFLLLGPGEAEDDATVTARTCAEAEAWMRGWALPGVTVRLISCEDRR